MGGHCYSFTHCDLCLQQPQELQLSSTDVGPSSSCQQSAVTSYPPSSSMQSSPSILPLKCSIETCDERFARMLQLIEHLHANHNQKLSATTLEFSTEASFDEWLHSTQTNNTYTFLRRTPHVRLFGTVTYYYCSRSGSSKCTVTTTERKLHLKVQGYTLNWPHLSSAHCETGE